MHLPNTVLPNMTHGSLQRFEPRSEHSQRLLFAVKDFPERELPTKTAAYPRIFLGRMELPAKSVHTVGLWLGFAVARTFCPGLMA
jgi:hypothetical protein